MGGQPEKILLHAERERVLALSRLFAPDPEHPDRIAPAALEQPLPEGISARISAADELVKFLGSSFPDVRRLAASALGKMAPEHPPAMTFLAKLADMAVSDAHPQVRQYAAKKLISVSFKDDANLIATLKEKLARYIRFSEPPPGA